MLQTPVPKQGWYVVFGLLLPTGNEQTSGGVKLIHGEMPWLGAPLHVRGALHFPTVTMFPLAS
jgi:hypothetical protein